jgi:alpha-beta hydrolase superfamily lysophospholipase
MAMETFTLKASADGLDLAGIVCAPAATPKAVVQMVHGMCEHKERYEPLMEYLAANGYACVMHDHRGHGASVKSPDDLGYMDKGGWKALVEDIRVVNDWIRQRFPSERIILFGHSMGSMAVRSFAKRYDDRIDALIVCGCPVDNPAKGAGKALAWIFGTTRGWHYRPHLLQKMSFGAYNKPFSGEHTRSAWVCSDPEALAAYNADPLCQYVFTANGFYNLMGLMQDCYGPKGWVLRHPAIPVRFISGEKDPCRGTDKQFHAAVDLMRKVGYSTVSFKVYPGMRHEIHNETGRDQVWRDLLQFLEDIRV